MYSREEIELKRRLAQEKLASKRSNNVVKPNLENQNGEKGAPGASPSSSKHLSFKEYKESPKHNVKPYGRAKKIKQFNGNEKGRSKKIKQFNGSEKVITGKCSLVAKERFVVELTGFCSLAIDIFRTIPTRRYNVKTRNWDFHIKDYGDLIRKLQSLRPLVMVEKMPPFVLNCVNKEDSDYSNIDLSRIDPELACALMSFQQEGIRYAIDKNGRCLIADDMGLGKTFQALGIASYYYEDWPLLIVTTTSMKNVWEQTIHQYLPSVPIMQVQYMTSSKDCIVDSRILIVSHDMMRRCVDILLNRQFGVLIIDESHMIKNIKAKCTEAATALAKKSKRVILLSGTPALSRPSELFPQLYLIDDKFFGNFYDYSRRYCDGKDTNFGWDASGKSNLQELEIILSRKFMIRRTKDDVLKALPNKTQEVVILDVNLDQFSDEDKKYLQSLSAKYENQKKSADLLAFFSESAKIKIPSVCSYILQVLKTNQKFLVFAHHQIMMDAISKVLDKEEVKYIRIDGKTTSEQRKCFVDKFQTNETCLVAVLSITAANAGITLTAARLVLFAELHWNPSILSQAESRAHRIGQPYPVVVKYLLAHGTADDPIYFNILQPKQKILEELGLSKDNFKNVAAIKQASDVLDFTENLNITLNHTCANPLDVSSCFKETKSGIKEDKSFGDDSDIFDDGLDDVFGSMDM